MSSSKESSQILSGKYTENMPALRLFFETVSVRLCVCVCVGGAGDWCGCASFVVSEKFPLINSYFRSQHSHL